MDLTGFKRCIKNSAGGGYFLAVQTLLLRKKIKSEIREELSTRLDCSPSKRLVSWCFWDYVHFRRKFRGDLHTDYFGTQLYRKSDFIRMESFATHVRFIWRDAINDRSLWKIFDNKSRLYPAFEKYLNRSWLYMDEKVSLDKFLRYLDGKKTVFAKIPESCGGKGVHLVDVDTDDRKRKLFEQCRRTPMIVEEPVRQCEELHAFSNYTAVNTLRIITIVDKGGNSHVAAAVLRIGREGSGVDNYSSGGMSALVDVDTGIVCTQATDKKGKNYIVHPDSGKQIVGFVIPGWERYKDFALELAKEYPTMRYVGWDIVKDRQGRMCMIEGNREAGADYIETGLLYGLLPHYDRLLNME